MTKRTQSSATRLQSIGYGLFLARLGGPAQQNLTDRSTGIRGDIDLRVGGAEEQQQGNNELSQQRTDPAAGQWEQGNDQTKPISHNAD